MGKRRAKVDIRQLIPIEKISGDSKKDTLFLKEMADEAREFLLSFEWCRSIRDSWFGWGVGGVCAVFFFEIEPTSKKVDQWLWVIVGDLPAAYLVIDDIQIPLGALAKYVDLMQAWVDAVKSKSPVDECIPVNAPATAEYANLLQRRLDFIRKEFLGVKPHVRKSKSRRHVS